MNYHYEGTQEGLNKVKIWTVKAYVDYENQVYAYTSLNKAIKKAYEIVKACIIEFDEVNGKGSFEKENGTDYVFKYSIKTCKELIKHSMIEDFAYGYMWSDSAYGYDKIYDIEIQGHDGKE